MKGKLTILLLLFFVTGYGQVRVPDTETFSLMDVYNAVNAHANPSANLSSCFANANINYFDSIYNNDSYAPANSMKRFRNYGGITVTTETFTSSGTWTCPTGISNITVEIWGAGGSGGSGGIDATRGGGGGAGGNYIKATYTVTPGNSYNYIVGSGGSNGTNGGYTQWNFDDGKIIQVGGGNAGYSYSAGAFGGGPGYISYSTGFTGLISSMGGTGANGTSTYSGGGGGAAGVNGDGTAGSGITGGSGNGPIAGNGGNGTNYSSVGGSGGSPFGGGGGGGTGTASGGNGFSGYIRITYW